MIRRRSETRTRRLVLVTAGMAVLGIAVFYHLSLFISHAQDPNGKVSHTVNGNTEVWKIDTPNVKEPVTPYPQIRFKPGDRITLDAGGCVQTGGVGDTWKRYVNPSGPDADKKYYGQIWIPGVIGGPAAGGVPPTPQRFLGHLGPNETVIVPSGIDVNQLFLRLGYIDSDYSDNGYYKHDDGTQNQCRNVGNAYVTITITHGNPPPPPTAPAPFDLVWDHEDDNGYPLNAKWGWQITHPGALPDPNQCANGPHLSPCTNFIVSLDTSEVCNLEQYEPFKDNSPPLYGIAGHGNWAAGTYAGRILWEEHSTPGTDDDYNFQFFPPGNAALTDVRNNLETEFDSDETIDRFTTPWWTQLHHTVDSQTDFGVNQSLFTEPDGTFGRYAIITGLIGIEFCHSGTSELHPVWAIAIRVDDRNPNDEVWAMFVRNWGDEGYCSGDQHYLTDLPNNTYTFRLPWRPGATSVSVLPSTTFKTRMGQASGPSVSWAQNQGLLASFGIPLTTSGTGEIIHGELHLNWSGGQGPAPIPGGPGPTPPLPDCATQCVFDKCKEMVNPSRAAYQQCESQCKQQCQNKNSTATARGRASEAATELEIRREEPEKQIAALLGRATATQRNQFLALLPRKTNAPDARPARMGAVTKLPTLRRNPPLPRKKQFTSVVDSNKQSQNQRLNDGLRRIFGATKR